VKVLADKVALVTGAGSGIGRATALAFAEAGAQVVVSDLDPAGGAATARAIVEAGGLASFVQVDVSSAAEVAELFARIASDHGRLDVAFNNAGVFPPVVATAELGEDDWDRTFAVNLRGAWLCLKQELELMVPRGRGAIVNCASVAGLVGYAGCSAYAATKHGLVGLTRSAALEYAPAGIRINAVCPAVVRTPMADAFFRLSPDSEANLIAKTPIGRLGTPEDVAAAVLWLCSDAASFVVGQALGIDGGWTAQ
jgi:NAD(P)-dependent dehydrogenase (short-subunit alcohol dehydrogenase family)